MPAADPPLALARILELVRGRIPRRFGFGPVGEVQMLCPINRGGVGARLLNVELQAALILDGRERVLGRMAKAFVPPEDAEVIGGEIAVVLQRRKDDGDDAYRLLIRRDEWEVVLPELDRFTRWSS